MAMHGKSIDRNFCSYFSFSGETEKEFEFSLFVICKMV